MKEKSPEQQLREFAEQRLGWNTPRGLFSAAEPPFDISRPNFHDSKQEFVFERDTVKNAVSHLQGVIDCLLRQGDEKTPEYNDMISRLLPSVEANALRSVKHGSVRSASEMAIKNVADSGFFYTSLLVVFEMLSAYQQRLSELKGQEVEFWSKPHRAPNYYARIIALRFARFYARTTGQKPTFGISSTGTHPSTDFGRLLEEVFSILKINASIRGPAEYAIEQITEQDIRPQAPLDSLSEFLGSDQNQPSSELIDELVEAMTAPIKD